MTSTYAAIKRDEIIASGFTYHNVVFEEAAQMTEIESLIPLTLQSDSHSNKIIRIVLCGDHHQNSPIVQNPVLRQHSNFDRSLFSRLVKLGVPMTQLDQQGRARESLAALYSWRYPGLGNLRHVLNVGEFGTANAGFLHEFQFLNVEDFNGAGEQEPHPHFLQNLGEAEYAVALFQYMRLLGYPANKVSILTAYAGQKALIQDVLDRRCLRNPLFGSPAHVATIDKFQGEQNDYIILSLVRTKRIGYLRDPRRLTVALSRSRLGLYIVGRRAVFQSCPDVKEAFFRLTKHPAKLQIVSEEMWPTRREPQDEVKSTTIEGLEHLGQLVYEMTQTKIASLATQKS